MHQTSRPPVTLELNGLLHGSGLHLHHKILLFLLTVEGAKIVVEGGKVQHGVPPQDCAGGDDSAQEVTHDGGQHKVLT